MSFILLCLVSLVSSVTDRVWASFLSLSLLLLLENKKRSLHEISVCCELMLLSSACKSHCDLKLASDLIAKRSSLKLTCFSRLNHSMSSLPEATSSL